ncbi:LOW QUALITY PROTEIN: fructose-2,6-bisphosphatase TIGAR [Dromiciops gliroides]|uniref:LOW QUALITY PROTEIN: fructose-2,6-bisphosphatase TIGAR n=1 Tax=Dromiciops gliroides TaxID=33562 RepID=UPI001CC48EE2|nr:LOW QUALITY PROTEIN: fructose-2,6-bisphosphatase TIGAR [Dromiciops gliroides]
MVRFALTVVRHGETRYNREKIIQGQGIDEPLSETGFRQAAAAGEFLSNVKFTHVFSSDLMRTKQTTAGILEKSRFCKEATVKYDTRLRERKYGIAEGKPLCELKALAKAAGEQCPYFTPPEGETLDQVKLRSKEFFEFLCQLILDETSEKGQPTSGTIDSGLETFLTENISVRSNCEPDINSDSVAQVLDANILVVSHGAYMKNMFTYFVVDLECTLPANLSKSELNSVSPNTGISHFIINVEPGAKEIRTTIKCICINLQDHLAKMTESA